MLKKILVLLTLVVSTAIAIGCNNTTTNPSTNPVTTGETIISTTPAPTTTATPTTLAPSTIAPTSQTSPTVGPTVTTATLPTTVVPTTSITGTTTSGELMSLSYQGGSLSSGMVGTAYSASIGTATGSSNITYTLKSGSVLPSGLSLSGHTISGTPTSVESKTFVIVADAVNAIAPVEATFTIQIDDIPGEKTYIFEAEYIDFTDQRGSGWSNTQTEWGMVMGDGESTPTSNGMYVAYFTPPYASLRFPFTSTQAGTGRLVFSMVSEYVKTFGTMQGMLLNPSIMTLTINGVSINYEIMILGENQPTIAFSEYVFLTEFQINEGDNLIEITMLNNDYFPGRTGGGPNVDYMKIVSELTLEMQLTCTTIDEVKMMRGY